MTQEKLGIEYEILTMKIQAKLYSGVLILCLAKHDWVGDIKRKGDVVRLYPSGEFLEIDRCVNISIPRAFELDANLATEIAGEVILKIKDHIDADILSAINKQAGTELYFVGKVLMAEGERGKDENFYDFVFAYGYKFK